LVEKIGVPGENHDITEILLKVALNTISLNLRLLITDRQKRHKL